MKKTTILFLFICSFFNAQFYETIKYPEYFSSTLARMTNNNTIDKINNSVSKLYLEDANENYKLYKGKSLLGSDLIFEYKMKLYYYETSMLVDFDDYTMQEVKKVKGKSVYEKIEITPEQKDVLNDLLKDTILLYLRREIWD